MTAKHDSAAGNQPADLRQAAAQAAVDYLKSQATASHIIGIGTGATVETFISLLANTDIYFDQYIASSERSAIALQQAGLKPQPLTHCGKVDFYIDGIDEGMANGMLIKGGGGALAREKILAAMSDIFITIADQGRLVTEFGRFALPIEILPVAEKTVCQQLEKMGGRPQLRKNFITDNGNLIVDVAGLDLQQPSVMEQRLNGIAGVVENGIFSRNRANFMAFSHAKGVQWITVTKN